MLVAYARRSGLPSFSERTCAASNGLARRFEVVQEESGETEIHQSPRLSVSPSPIALAICAPSSRERHRFWVDVPIHGHDAKRAQAACELSLQRSAPAGRAGSAQRAPPLPGRTRVGRRWRPGTSPPPARRRSRLRGRQPSKPAVRAEQLERLGSVEPAVHPEERVEGFEHRQRHVLVVLGQDPLGRSAKVVQLAPQFVPRNRELWTHERRLPLHQHGRVVTCVSLACVSLLAG